MTEDPIERYARQPRWWNLLCMGGDYLLGLLSGIGGVVKMAFGRMPTDD